MQHTKRPYKNWINEVVREAPAEPGCSHPLQPLTTYHRYISLPMHSPLTLHQLELDVKPEFQFSLLQGKPHKDRGTGVLQLRQQERTKSFSNSQITKYLHKTN